MEEKQKAPGGARETETKIVQNIENQPKCMKNDALSTGIKGIESKVISTAKIAELVDGNKMPSRRYRTARECAEEAAQKPMPNKLFGSLWFEHETCILFADTGLGKSTLAVQLADALTRKIPILGYTPEGGPYKVIYWDFEMSDKQFQIRCSNSDGLLHPFSDDFLRDGRREAKEIPDNVDGITYYKGAIENSIRETNSNVLIIDNITWLSSEGTEKAKDAAPLMKWFATINDTFQISTLILAHTPKVADFIKLSINHLAGSKMIQNFADNIFALGKSSKGERIRYLKQFKCRDAENLFTADNVMEIELQQDASATLRHFILNGYGPEDEHLKTDPGPNKRESAQRLRKEGKSYEEIAELLGLSKSTAFNYCAK